MLFGFWVFVGYASQTLHVVVGVLRPGVGDADKPTIGTDFFRDYASTVAPHVAGIFPYMHSVFRVTFRFIRVNSHSLAFVLAGLVTPVADLDPVRCIGYVSPLPLGYSLSEFALSPAEFPHCFFGYPDDLIRRLGGEAKG